MKASQPAAQEEFQLNLLQQIKFKLFQAPASVSNEWKQWSESELLEWVGYKFVASFHSHCFHLYISFSSAHITLIFNYTGVHFIAMQLEWMLAMLQAASEIDAATNTWSGSGNERQAQQQKRRQHWIYFCFRKQKINEMQASARGTTELESAAIIF